MPNCPNQVALILGASGGVGSAIAKRLAGKGVSLVLVGRNMSLLESISRRIQTNGTSIRIFKAELTHDEDILELTARVQEEFDHLDILIHGAGVIEMGPVANIPVQQFDWQYRVNARAPYLLTQSLLPMLKSCQGQVVFMNSSAGLVARANVGQYAATKFALKAIADSLREEVNQHGVRVISVYLGRTASAMQMKVHELEEREYHPERLIQPDEIAKLLAAVLELPRTIEVTDILARPMMKSS